MHKEIKRYIKDIQLMFPIYGKDEKTYMNVLRERMEEYEFEHPELTYASLEAEFGTPADVIADYFTEVDENRLFRKMNIRRMVSGSIAIILALLIIFTGYHNFLWYYDYSTSGNSDTGSVKVYYEPFTEE